MSAFLESGASTYLPRCCSGAEQGVTELKVQRSEVGKFSLDQCLNVRIVSTGYMQFDSALPYMTEMQSTNLPA